MNPRLSIIVPAYNEAKLLAGNLRRIQSAMAQAQCSESDWQLIVCDNNSSDDTAVLARDAGAEVVFEPINQIARARNCGASIAKGQWLLFIDADSYTSAGLMADVLASLNREDMIGAGATFNVVNGPWWFRYFFAWGGNFWMRYGRMASGAFLLVRTDAFNAIGGFSQVLYAAEELDLVQRLKSLGKQRQQKFTVFHKHSFYTSGRKGVLYKKSVFLKLFFDFFRSPSKTLKNPKYLSIWYDGKR